MGASTATPPTIITHPPNGGPLPPAQVHVFSTPFKPPLTSRSKGSASIILSYFFYCNTPCIQPVWRSLTSSALSANLKIDDGHENCMLDINCVLSRAALRDPSQSNIAPSSPQLSPLFLCDVMGLRALSPVVPPSSRHSSSIDRAAVPSQVNYNYQQEKHTAQSRICHR